jgi:hypothetical protein
MKYFLPTDVATGANCHMIREMANMGAIRVEPPIKLLLIAAQTYNIIFL